MFAFLKQSTASQSRNVGPFVDDTDFKTTETGLTIANTDVKLCKNGGTSANKNSGGGTHRVNGMYSLTFDATDTDTVGELNGSIVVSGALPVVFKFWVLEEAIYDSLFGASAGGFDSNQRVDVGSWLGTAVTLSSGAPDVNVQSLDDIDLSTTMKASVNTEVDTGLSDIGLDHLVGASVTGTDVTDNSIIARMVSKSATADWDSFSNTTDSLEAIRDKQTDIETDTQDIQTQIGTAGAGLTDLGGMSTAMKAEVNTEVVDTLNTDTYGEPGQEAPGATVSLTTKIGYLYKAWRNKSTQTSSTYSLFADDTTTVDQKATVSDDGTTATKAEVGTGP